MQPKLLQTQRCRSVHSASLRCVFLYSLLIWFVIYPSSVRAFNGPIELENPYPPAALHLSFSPTSAEVRPRGSGSAKLNLLWGNTFTRRRKSYLVDAETRTTTLALRYTPIAKLEVGTDAVVHWRGGGIFDEALDNWHEFFGFHRGGRNDLPYNDYAISGTNDDGSTFDINDRGFGFGDLRLHAKYQLAEERGIVPAWAITTALLLPTGEDTFGQDGIDVLAGTVASKTFGKLRIYAAAAYTYFTDPTTNGLEFQRHNASAFSVGEYAVTSSFSLLTQLVLYSNMLDNLRGFPDHSLYFDLGAKYRSSEKTTFELLLRENPTPRTGTTDVAVLLGIERQFGR